MCLPWYDHVHRSTRESSHAPSHGELDTQSKLRPSHCGGVWLQTRLLPLRALCSKSLFKGSLTLLSPGRLSWGRVLRARAFSHQILVGPDVPLDMETLFPVDVAQRPWNWPVGATGWEAPTATVSASHVCYRPRRVRGACNVTVRVLKCNCPFQSSGIQRHT